MSVIDTLIRVDAEHLSVRLIGDPRRPSGYLCKCGEETLPTLEARAVHRAEAVAAAVRGMGVQELGELLPVELDIHHNAAVCPYCTKAPHCDTCVCGRRAPVQGEYSEPRRAPGTVAWEEHLKAYEGYAAQYGTTQSAERLAERGGFGYNELVMFLGHEPETWSVR